jgi:Iron-sulfur cluster assembly protein
MMRTVALAVIPILPADEFARPVLEPSLQGPAEALQRVLRGLRAVVDCRGGNLVDRRCICALRLADGEAELSLNLSPRRSEDRLLCEQAFAVLRRLLPDTDVFVHHRG